MCHSVVECPHFAFSLHPRRSGWGVALKPTAVRVGGRRSWPSAPELARVCATIQPIVKLPTDQRL
eukprot:5440403-Prymnesium_polylepis.1